MCPEITVVHVEAELWFEEASDFYQQVLGKLPGVRKLSPSMEISTRAFRHALAQFHQKRLETRPNHRLLLMVDEYPYLIPDGEKQKGVRDFHAVLGVLKSMHQEGWLLWLPCGRTAAVNWRANLGDHENPCIDMFHSVFLKPFTREENDALMRTLGMRGGLSFTEEALDVVYRESGGHPAFSRALGELAAESGVEKIGAEHVQDAVSKWLGKRDNQTVPLAIHEKRLSDRERRIARLVALEGPLPSEEILSLDAEGDAWDEMRDVLHNLLETAVLVEGADGRIKHRYGLPQRVIMKIEASNA